MQCSPNSISTYFSQITLEFLLTCQNYRLYPVFSPAKLGKINELVFEMFPTLFSTLLLSMCHLHNCQSRKDDSGGNVNRENTF